MSYCIIRMYRDDTPSRTLRRGLTLEEAREHCSDPETSSSTATRDAAKRHTDKHGPWFDGYEEE